MKKFTILAVLIISIGTVLLASVIGCGPSTKVIKYDNSPGKPVVMLSQSQAIAPQYNPGAPDTIVYGNGLIVKKEDSYSYVAGMTTRDEVAKLVQKLQDQNYFEMKANNKSKQSLMGGVTNTLTVYAKDKTYRVTVEAGAQPKGWSTVLKTIKGAKAPDMHEYNPPKVKVYATEVSSAPAGAVVEEWPALRDALENAAAAGSKGYIDQMEAGISDWLAIQGVYKKGQLDNTCWKTYVGKLYTSVYAFPLWPGLPEEL